MLLKLIACNVFMREACLGIAHSPHVIDVEFLELGEHIHSDRLRQTLQAKIDRAEEDAKKYDAILLLYGLCGNAAVGLRVRKTRLVLPRAHDCCTILLGSKQRFQEHFEHAPSTPFSSIGYLERGEYFVRTDTGEGQIEYGDQYAALVEQYGEDNAKYIWENMHPESSESGDKRVVFIDIPETSPLGGEQRFRNKAEQKSLEVARLDGDLRLIRSLLNGDWSDEDFLIVEPGHQTSGVYDWAEVVRATPVKPAE
jgi:hypothetical protein